MFGCISQSRIKTDKNGSAGYAYRAHGVGTMYIGNVKWAQ